MNVSVSSDVTSVLNSPIHLVAFTKYVVLPSRSQ